MLIVSVDSLSRLSSKPFFFDLMERIEEGIANGRPAGGRAG